MTDLLTVKAGPKAGWTDTVEFASVSIVEQSFPVAKE
jgi:hypothetical protein